LTIVMGKRLTILLLTLFTSIITSTPGFSAAQSHQMPLRDGFALTGVDGRLVIHDSNEKSQDFAFDGWFFEFDSDVNDGRGLIKAGASLELLPSSALERMIADANNSSNTYYRLGGRVTQYKGRNFIFPTYFLPLAKTKKSEPSTSQKSPQQQGRPKINEPNDVLTIPKELIEKLPDRKKRIDHRTLEEPAEETGTELGGKRKPGLTQDFILANRIGFIRESGHGAQDIWRQVSFVLDALGRTESKISLHLLPCQALEQAQRKQSAEPETLRFKIAGIVTEYKGNQYLLLQRVTRVYSHGNFPG
jgi:hypothetical protein